ITSAAYLTILSAYLTAGQRCSCARRLIIPKWDDADEFIEKLISMIEKIKVGPYTDLPEPFMGPVINAATAKRLLKAQDNLQAKGGIPLVPMTHLNENRGLLSPGLMDVSSIQEKPDEELFGPFLQLIRVTDLDEAIGEANRTAYGLTAGLLSDEAEHYQ